MVDAPAGVEARECRRCAARDGLWLGEEGGATLDRCGHCRVMLQAAVFVRRRATRLGPYRFGHVGWAFQLLPWQESWSERAESAVVGGWSAGSVENAEGIPLRRPSRSGFWAEVVDTPGPLMVAYRYDEYKLLTVEDAGPEAAQRAQLRAGARPYVLLGLNCVNAVCRVLDAFGASLPSAYRHLVPNDWYDRIPGPSIRVGRLE